MIAKMEFSSAVDNIARTTLFNQPHLFGGGNCPPEGGEQSPPSHLRHRTHPPSSISKMGLVIMTIVSKESAGLSKIILRNIGYSNLLKSHGGSRITFSSYTVPERESIFCSPPPPKTNEDLSLSLLDSTSQGEGKQKSSCSTGLETCECQKP